jgi:hypothetical protein
MSNVVNKIFTDKMGGRNPSEYIGTPGELFYDPNTGVVKVSDGVTAGGKSIAESSPLESLYIGDWVYFVRPNDDWNQEISYQDVVDKISDTLWIKRAPYGEGQGSLFNAAPNPEEGGDPFDSNGSVNTPYGTEWNTDGWADFSNTTDRYYENLTNTFNGGGWSTPMHEYIMRDTQSNKYYAIRFLTWDGGGNQNQGGFSYIRRQINTDIYFNRADTNSEEEALDNGDEIAPNLVIVRGNNQAIFNYGFITEPRWTNFNAMESFGATWYENGVVAIEWDTSADIDTALKQLKVGDEIYLDNGDGFAESTIITVAFNADTGTFTTSDVPPAQFSISSMYMNLTKPWRAELDWDNDQSPLGTLWNAEGWDDLTNLSSRQFLLFDDLSSNNLGKRIVGKELVMHDTLNDKYYAIKFTRWQQGSQGQNWDYPGFAYTRRLIDTEKLSSGLKFNDGSIQTTAYTQKAAGTLKVANTANVGTRYINADDIGKMILVTNSDFNQLRINDAGSAEFPIGATITIVNMTGSSIYVGKDNDDENGTIYGAGTGNNSSSWEIPDTGGGNIAVLVKIRTYQDNFGNDWMLSGSGILTD